MIVPQVPMPYCLSCCVPAEEARIYVNQFHVDVHVKCHGKTEWVRIECEDVFAGKAQRYVFRKAAFNSHNLVVVP